MKKLLLLGGLSLTVIFLATGPASAWFWDRLCGGCHGCQCTVKVSYRPYNAFDPGCSGATVNGNLGALFGGMGCPCWAPPPYMPSCYNGPSCINSGCCDAGCLPAPDADSAPAIVPGAPAAPAPGAPAFTPPMPNPLPTTSQMYYYPIPVAQNQVRPAGYYPNFYPGYYQNYPVGYNPQAMQPYPVQQYPVGYNPAMQGYPAPNYPYGMPTYGQNYGR